MKTSSGNVEIRLDVKSLWVCMHYNDHDLDLDMNLHVSEWSCLIEASWLYVADVVEGQGSEFSHDNYQGK